MSLWVCSLHSISHHVHMGTSSVAGVDQSLGDGTLPVTSIYGVRVQDVAARKRSLRNSVYTLGGISRASPGVFCCKIAAACHIRGLHNVLRRSFIQLLTYVSAHKSTSPDHCRRSDLIGSGFYHANDVDHCLRMESSLYVVIIGSIILDGNILGRNRASYPHLAKVRVHSQAPAMYNPRVLLPNVSDGPF